MFLSFSFLRAIALRLITLLITGLITLFQDTENLREFTQISQKKGGRAKEEVSSEM